MKTKKPTSSETWCAVYTAWPVSSQGGRSRVAHREASRRAFTWSDVPGIGEGLRVLRVDPRIWETGGSK